MIRHCLNFFLLCAFVGSFLLADLAHAQEPTYEWEKWNYYEILGVEPTASPEEIRQAYKQQAKKWHSDKYMDQPEAMQKEVQARMQKINIAGDTLKDPIEKEKYDREGHARYEEDLKDSTRSTPQKSKYDGVFKQTPSNVRGNEILHPLFTGSMENLTKHEKAALNLFKGFSFFHMPPETFNKNDIEYRELLMKREKGEFLSETDKERLQSYIQSEQKDLEVFKNILNKLGLPTRGVVHPELLNHYWDALKREWIQIGELLPTVRFLVANIETKVGKEKKNKLVDPSRFDMKLEVFGQRFSAGRQYVSVEVEATRTALNKVKEHIDLMTYENLRTQANPITMQHIKSFPLQFIFFGLAIGASTYLHSNLQEKQLGAQLIPGEHSVIPGELVQATNGILSPYGIVNFYIFVLASQQIHKSLYGAGRWIDGKSLSVLGRTHTFNGITARALSPSVGLGAGYFVSRFIDDFWADPYFTSCVKSQFNEEAQTQEEHTVYRDHISSCEQFGLNWQASEKWWSYAVDISSLIGSSVISHRVVHALSNFAMGRYAFSSYSTSKLGKNLAVNRRAETGLKWFVKQAWRAKSLNLIGFFTNFLAFIEVHKTLEEAVGAPIKNQTVEVGVKDSLYSLQEDLGNLLDNKTADFWMQEINDPIEPQWYHSGEIIIAHTNQTNDDDLQYGHLTGKMKEVVYRFQNWANLRNLKHRNSNFYWSEYTKRQRENYDLSKNILEQVFSKGLMPDQGFNKCRGNFYCFNTFVLSEEAFGTDYKEEYCEKIRELATDTENPELPHWQNFCNKKVEAREAFHEGYKLQDQATVHYATLYETTYIINDYLQQINIFDYEDSQGIAQYLGMGEGFLVQDYISQKEEELFSSDPQFSLEKLKYKKIQYTQTVERTVISYEKLLVLARALIQEGILALDSIENIITILSNTKDEDSSLQSELRKEAVLLFKQLAVELLSFEVQPPEEFFEYSALENWLPQKNQDKIKTWCGEDNEDCISVLNDETIIGYVDYLLQQAIAQAGRANKLLMGGVYILRQILKNIPYNSSAYINNSLGNHNVVKNQLDAISPLLDLLSVHRAGEQLLEESEISNPIKEQLDVSLTAIQELANDPLFGIDDLLKDKTIGDPAYVMNSLLCGGTAKEGFFNPPAFFKELLTGVGIYDFQTKNYHSLSEYCDKGVDNVRKLVFHSPAQYQGQNYENLFLVLNKILTEKYPVSEELEYIEAYQKAKNLLLADYETSSLESLRDVADSSIKSLKSLTDNFYRKSIRLNSDVDKESTIENFLIYYHIDNIGWNWCQFSNDSNLVAPFGWKLGKTFDWFNKIVGLCQEPDGLKEIELIIFQVNYWLETLKALLAKGQKLQVNINTANVEEGNDNNAEEYAKECREEEGLCVSLNYATKCLEDNLYDCKFLDKTLIQKSEEEDYQALDEQSFDAGFEALQRQTLSCLQAQHDYFKPNSKISRDDLEEICFPQEGTNLEYQTARSDFLNNPNSEISSRDELEEKYFSASSNKEQKGVNSHSTFLYISEYYMQNVILERLALNQMFLSNFDNNKDLISNRWNKVLYSALDGLYKSLKDFNISINTLKLQERLSDQKE